jgi:hypothetical protein
MSDTARFQIIYSGPSLENNEMDIRELAPALIAVADLLEESNLIINGGGTKINVNVHGSFKSGSFGIDLTVIQDIYQSIMDFFNSQGITAASNLLALIGLKEVGQGLLGLIKWLRNRKIKKVDKISEDRVSIHITSDEKIEVDARVLDLYKSQRVRDALSKVVSEPLSREGINEFRSVVEGTKQSVIVTKDEKEYFELPLLGDELLGENVTEAFLQVVSLSFKEDNKWRFSRGESVFYAMIKDEEFLAKIDRNEVHFSKDDILHVSLQARDFLSTKGIRTEYIILKVIEHRSAAIQLPLPIDDDRNNPDSKTD